MEREAELFTKSVLEKTGIVMELFDANGNSNSSGEKVSVNFSEPVFSDIEKKRTLFRIKVKNKTYIAKIMGAGRAERNYAALISSYAENFVVRENYTGKEEFLRAVLSGNVSTAQIEINVKKYSLYYDSGFMMKIVFPEERKEEVLNVLNTYSEEKDIIVIMEDSEIAYCRPFKNNIGEKDISRIFAENLVKSVYEETGVNIKVGIGGEINNPTDTVSSYAQASAALRLSNVFKIEGSVHAYRDFIFYKILEDIPEVRLEQYLSFIVNGSAGEVFKNKELIDTAVEFLTCNLNSSETARKLFLHRNTLSYRLDRLEMQTGLDIRKFNDAVTFKTALLLYEIVESRKNKN